MGMWSRFTRIWPKGRSVIETREGEAPAPETVPIVKAQRLQHKSVDQAEVILKATGGLLLVGGKKVKAPKVASCLDALDEVKAPAKVFAEKPGHAKVHVAHKLAGKLKVAKAALPEVESDHEGGTSEEDDPGFGLEDDDDEPWDDPGGPGLGAALEPPAPVAPPAGADALAGLEEVGGSDDGAEHAGAELPCLPDVADEGAAAPPDSLAPPAPAAVAAPEVKRARRDKFPRLVAPGGAKFLRCSVNLADGSRDFRAACGHCEATLSRTCRPAPPGGRNAAVNGQGRPFGMLWAWLTHPCGGNPQVHKAFRANFVERKNARAQERVEAVPVNEFSVQDFFDFERAQTPVLDDVDGEPFHIP